jgi:hypothetical protein
MMVHQYITTRTTCSSRTSYYCLLANEYSKLLLTPFNLLLLLPPCFQPPRPSVCIPLRVLANQLLGQRNVLLLGILLRRALICPLLPALVRRFLLLNLLASPILLMIMVVLLMVAVHRVLHFPPLPRSLTSRGKRGRRGRRGRSRKKQETVREIPYLQIKHSGLRLRADIFALCNLSQGVQL